MQAIKKIALAACLLTAGLAHSSDYPRPTGFVNDFAGIIDTGTRLQLTNIIGQFEQRTGDEIAVATVKSLGGEPIENYAVGLYKQWGIGKKGKDNGVLILVAPAEREMRIEVGYGLEPLINDALAGRIVRDTMIPHFRGGDFPLGILNGTIEVITIISKKSGVEFDPISAGAIVQQDIYHVGKASGAKESFIFKLLKVIFIIFIVILFIKNPWAALFILSSVGGGRGGSFRGGFGSGFSGFGGGLSGGGGSSGRW